MIREMLDFVFNRNKIKNENNPITIQRGIQFIELIEEIGTVSRLTSSWKLAKANTYIGSEIELTYKISNIVGGSFFIELINKFEIEPIFYDSEEKDYQSVFLFYYGKQVEQQLLGYSKGDLVKLKANFQSVFYFSRLVLQFEIISIDKSNSCSEVDLIGDTIYSKATVLRKVNVLNTVT